MTSSESSQSEHVNLRDVWLNESINFTPWLAKNLHLLDKAIGMKLTLIQEEAPGWSGFLDILAERGDGAKVAIENQLEASDSDHFARLLGYAAEHDARELVWVAPQFWEYHLKQIAWLNKVMAGNARIHAVAVRLLPGSNGDLRPADSDDSAHRFRPEFASVTLDENNPKWAILKAGDLSETDQKYQQFFLQLLGDLRKAGFTDRTTAQAGQSQSFPSEYPSVSYNAGFGWGTAIVDIWISAGAYDKSVRIYDALYRYREELEGELNDLQFDVIGSLGGWQRVSLGMTRPDSHIGDSDDTLAEIRDWMSDAIVRLKETVEPRLQKVMAALQSENPTP